MKVSVVIRTYNRGYVIAEAIASVLGQTYDDFEIIVVDDGSTDNTFEVVKQFRNDKIQYIRHDRNRGVSAAGNTGIRVATGDVIAHLDSDDLWKPEMLRTLVDFLNRNPEVGAVFCDVEVIRNAESISSIAAGMHAFPKLLALHSNADDVVFSSREMYLCLLEEVPIKPTAVLIRRNVLDTVGGYDNSWLSGEDWELYLRISKCYRFGYTNRKLATMRVYSRFYTVEIPRAGQNFFATIGNQRKESRSGRPRSLTGGKSRDRSALQRLGLYLFAFRKTDEIPFNLCPRVC